MRQRIHPAYLLLWKDLLTRRTTYRSTFDVGRLLFSLELKFRRRWDALNVKKGNFWSLFFHNCNGSYWSLSNNNRWTWTIDKVLSFLGFFMLFGETNWLLSTWYYLNFALVKMTLRLNFEHSLRWFIICIQWQLTYIASMFD